MPNGFRALVGLLAFVLVNKPVEGLFGIGIIGSGLLLYALSRARSRAR